MHLRRRDSKFFDFLAWRILGAIFSQHILLDSSSSSSHYRACHCLLVPGVTSFVIYIGVYRCLYNMVHGTCVIRYEIGIIRLSPYWHPLWTIYKGQQHWNEGYHNDMLQVFILGMSTENLESLLLHYCQWVIYCISDRNVGFHRMTHT